MIRAKIVTKDGNSQRNLEVLSLSERPVVGSEIAGKYKVISISEPVPIGANLSAGEPDWGMQICVEEL
jgi:hypothetical protein